MKRFALAATVALTLPASLPSLAAADPLPSWADDGAQAAITAFVEAVSTEGSPDFVPEPERIAVFDNDGTLWAEQPIYFQLYYALDRLQERAKADPAILTSDALKAAAAGDMEAFAATGKEGLLDLITTTHSGMSTEAFIADVKDWLATATHPETGKPYDQMTYAPMVELLEYLRANGFATWIVSGGGQHFIRAFAEEAYGIPPEQVVGTMTETSYELIDGVPTVLKQPSIAFIDDKAGKPVGIDRAIGRRPILAGGNSDGDFEMLEWVTAGDGARLGLIVHHTDGEREFAYDREGHVGVLNRGLDEGPGKGWVIVDMKGEWSRIWAE